MSYTRTKVWVWFKGGLDGGEWRGGFYATDNAEHEEAVTLQHGDFKDCVVPTCLTSSCDVAHRSYKAQAALRLYDAADQSSARFYTMGSR